MKLYVTKIYICTIITKQFILNTIILIYVFSVSLLFAVGVSSLLFSLHFSTCEALGAPQGGKSRLRDMGRGGWSSGWLVQGVGGGGGTMSQ